MFSLNSRTLLTLLPLFLSVSARPTGPNRAAHRQRADGYTDDVKEAVANFYHADIAADYVAATPTTLFTPAEATDISPLADAHVLAVHGDVDEEGYWQVYTTTIWVAAGSVETSASNGQSPISAFVDAGVQQSSSVVGVQAAATAPAPPPPPPAPSVPSAPPGTLRPPAPSVSMAPGPGQSSAVSKPPVYSSAPVASSSPSSPATTPTTSQAVSTPSTSAVTGGNGNGGGSYLPGKHIFAHFMVGIVSTYKNADWVADITLAKAKGITGFALNIGVDPYSQAQLDLAYEAAAQVGSFDMFISFDFNWYHIGDTANVANMMKRYVDHPAQLLIDGKPFVSSFIGDGFDWKACASMVGRDIYAVPFFQPSAQTAGDAGVSGLFSWAAWPGQLDNQPLMANMTVARDDDYLGVLNAVGKQYMAPISPWFSTHFGPEVSYSKNWLFYSEMLWKTRWDQILELGQQGVNLVEIVTWNDYGESHHIGPYGTAHTDDGASKWAEGLDHSAMLDFAVPYIEAFKRGEASPVVLEENLVYWHRPHLKSASCDSTDNCGSKPKGWDMVSDSVFVSTMTLNGGTVTVNSGSGATFTQTVAAGVQSFQVPMSAGVQSFKLVTNSGLTASGSSNVTVSDNCWNGIYNYNFHSGTVA